MGQPRMALGGSRDPLAGEGTGKDRDPRPPAKQGHPHLDAEAELGGRPVVLLALRHVVDVGLGEVSEVLEVPGVLGWGGGESGPAPPHPPGRAPACALTLEVPLVE